jgi:transcriptional regulator with XRE-family HTH domain
LKDKEIRIGNFLREMRESAAHSQEAIAHLCDVDVRSIYNLEKGNHLPNLDFFAKFAVSLNMKPSDLLKEIEEKTNFLTVIKRDVESRR